MPKFCPRCQTTKELEEFSLNKARTDGHSGYCRPCQNDAQAEYVQTLRLAAFNVLGPQCARCGITDVRVLCFDHINGGGTKARRESTGGSAVLRRIIGGEPGFQVLCHNCNFIKRLDEGEHVGDRVYVRGITSAEARVLRLSDETISI